MLNRWNVCSGVPAYSFVVRNSEIMTLPRLKDSGDMALANDGEALAFGRNIIRNLIREGGAPAVFHRVRL